MPGAKDSGCCTDGGWPVWPSDQLVEMGWGVSQNSDHIIQSTWQRENGILVQKRAKPHIRLVSTLSKSPAECLFPERNPASFSERSELSFTFFFFKAKTVF